MKRIDMLLASIVAVGYSHGRSETVLVSQGRGKGPLRINKSDFNEKEHKLYSGDDADELNTGVASGKMSDVNETGANGVQTTAAPSAPDFSPGDADAKPPIDETKQAAAPIGTTADQLLVMKQGRGNSAKFFIADGLGNKITGDRAKLLGIDEDGYDTEEAAKAVQSNTEPSKAQ